MDITNGKVPVTVLTGFLGAGKTTLLNRILTENHGKRIAVIENEFGEIGIDDAIVINSDEEIFEMNNGCICCTVRGDLIRILGSLMRRRDKFDYILVETTGLANPAPVAQTFFVDDEIREQLELDGIVTVIDCKHVAMHLGESQECDEQVAFADVILLNKTDLVDDDAVSELEGRIRSRNALAKIYRTSNATIEMEKILNVNGFKLDKALATKPTFLEPEYPFEWGGLFELNGDSKMLVLQDGPDPKMNVLFLRAPDNEAGSITKLAETAVRFFSNNKKQISPGEKIDSSDQLYELSLPEEGSKTFEVALKEPGRYVFYTQHLPEEFSLEICTTSGTIEPIDFEVYDAGHTHDSEVSSVGIDSDGDLDEEKLMNWLGTLLREKGTDIFRMKGILSVAGQNERFIFQGVHMLFDGKRDRPWGDEKRTNQLIFIGRNLNREELVEGFNSCLAKKPHLSFH
ncbi:MAG: GTP-binding protein [Cryomorphaceae bacterium]|nr:GTP-binding protein [Cryomorphaceae bacterium]